MPNGGPFPRSWVRAGVWERLLSLMQQWEVQLSLVFFDCTKMQAHCVVSRLYASVSERPARSTGTHAFGNQG